MAKRNTGWKRLSIRVKVMIWVTIMAFVSISLFSWFFYVQRNVVEQYAHLMDDNVLCHQVQDAFEAERKAFLAYVREVSAENLQNYEQACADTSTAMAALPFDYELIGEDRYARTWNLVNGYEGYTQYRDAVIAADPADDDFTDRYYQVALMQESLSDNVMRLVQLTLEEGNLAYLARARLLSVLPWIYALMLAMSFSVVLGIFQFLSQSVVRPMTMLAAASRQIENNDFSGPDIPVESGDEVGELVTAFNRMKHATGDYITTLHEKNRIAAALHQQELERLELEQHMDRIRMEMLKSQVNPHFLFNTLNMISCMARLEDAETTNRMILSLGNLFRYNLRTKEQEVYLQQEIEALDDYVYIQQMRFDGRITYRKEILVDPETVRIPSFTLQPVVENAFAHGLSAKEADGRIVLRIWQEGHRVIVSIADNGRGMDEAELSSLRRKIRDSEQTGKGIGLGNISRRISMMYADGDFRIYSKPGCGTVIQFAVPQTTEKR